MSMNRRSVLKTAAALGLMAGGGLTSFAKAWAQEAKFKPEDGAAITFLRYKGFLQVEAQKFQAICDAFSSATGAKVTVATESIDDIQPKAAIAANTGSGPDIILGLYSLAHLFSDKCLDLTDLASDIGTKAGGWFPSAEKYGRSKDKWISIPFFFTGNPLNYRVSHIEKAGFKEVPKDLPGFAELLKALKANGTPGGFALGHATSDANNWTHWCLWAHNGSLIDENANVIINSPETEAALVYAKQIAEHFAPGAASWNDGSNNKAFLAGELSLTNNGISIYLTAKKDKPDVAADMNHAWFPIGPAGKATTFDTCYAANVLNYTKYPEACKALLSFFMAVNEYGDYLNTSGGFISHPLKAFDDNPVWSSDPKVALLKDTAANTMTAGHRGPVDQRAAAALSDFIIVDMFANVCTGAQDPQTAMKNAERQAKRIYRS